VSTSRDELGRTTTYIRFSNGVVGQIFFPDGSTEAWNGLNAFNQPTIHLFRNGSYEWLTYDATGRLTRRSEPVYSGNPTAFTHYTYYPDSHAWKDRIETVTDPRGKVTRYEYDLAFVNGVQGTTPCPGRGLVTKIIHPDNTYQTFGYDSFGNKVWEENELRQRTTYTYDAYNRVRTITDPLNQTTQHVYGDSTVEAMRHTRNAPKRIFAPSGRVTTFSYTGNHRVSRKIEGDQSVDAKSWRYNYDGSGNLIETSEQVGGNSGSEVWRDTTFSYDNRDRRRYEYAPLGRTTEWQYDAVGNNTKIVFPDGTHRSKTFDAGNRPLTETDERGYVTTYTYHPSGMVNTITDPRNSVHSHEYDQRNRLARRVYPGGSSESWTYDTAGNPATYTNRSGQVLRYTFDNRNRETNRVWDNSAAPAVSTGYDAASRVTSRSNSNGSIGYSYDAAGRLTSTTEAVNGGPTITLTYGYDVDGLRTVFQSSIGSWTGYAYNNRGELTHLQTWSGGPATWSTYTRDIAGQLIQQTFYNGVRDDLGYDGAGRLTSRNTIRSSDGASLLPRRYAYDLRDRRTWSMRFDNGDTYEYFPDGQLNRFRFNLWRPDQNFWNAPASTQTFAYDQAGNRTSFNNNGAITNYTANALNQYTAVTGATISHNDNRGNLTGYNEWSYSYDADNRLVSATKSGYGVYFYYDAEGRLSKVNRNGTWEYRYYDGPQCFFRSTASGTWIDLMIWGPTPDELNARYAPSSGGWSFFHREPINSVDVATDIGGNVVERYLYDPFGKPEIRDAGWNIRSSSIIANPYLFTGQEWMADLGLANYKNRFYNPTLGRFLQNDPIRFDGGDLNLYRYCGKQPHLLSRS